MNRKLIFHVGTSKTGTTSIQNWLENNPIILGGNGYKFPSFREDKRYHGNIHAEICAAISEENDELCPSNSVKHTLRIEGRADQRRVSNAVSERLARCVEDSNSEITLFSNEHFMTCVYDIASAEAAKRFLGRFFDSFTIVIYLRRQEDFLVSQWSQLSKFSDKGDLREYCKLNSVLDYSKLIEPISNIFGAENIKVRLAQPDFLIGDSPVEDFCGLLNLPCSPGEAAVKHNKSPSLPAIELLRHYAKSNPPHIYGTYPNPLYWKIRNVAEEIGSSYSRPILPPEDIDRIRIDNLAGNKEVCAKFLPERRHLFPERENVYYQSDLPLELAELSALLIQETQKRHFWKLSLRDRLEPFRYIASRALRNLFQMGSLRK